MYTLSLMGLLTRPLTQHVEQGWGDARDMNGRQRQRSAGVAPHAFDPSHALVRSCSVWGTRGMPSTGEKQSDGDGLAAPVAHPDATQPSPRNVLPAHRSVS